MPIPQNFANTLAADPNKKQLINSMSWFSILRVQLGLSDSGYIILKTNLLPLLASAFLIEKLTHSRA